MSSSCDRVIKVLGQLFGGNQARMSGAIGVSPSLLNKVIRRAHPPSEDLLRRIADLSGLNQHWVMTGEPPMFTTPPSDTLPVSEALLLGSPSENAALLSGGHYGVMPDFARASCYYHRVRADSPFVQLLGGEYRPDDLLLFETDRRVIASLMQTKPRLCLVHVGEYSQTTPLWGRLEHQPEQGWVLMQQKLVAKLLTEKAEPIPYPEIKVRRRIDARLIGDFGDDDTPSAPEAAKKPKEGGIKKPAEKDSEGSTEKKPMESPQAVWRFRLQDVVGLQLMQVRT
ncbi:helix-turn-helix transcriptional regulator [Zavarzinella formosa]|uniref:helix-turn-helix transcriptional regulator n=1 Tax=Zavarzinella formosa TaxID=360055 RepID=UPI00138ABAC8|nr:helix-turn-helix transcriptional regulator [Zavarzinella formosa]